MNKHTKTPGFTLIELIVVISIMSTLLLFSLPLFNGFNLFSNSPDQVGDLVRLINDLKKRSVNQNKDFLMHMDSSSNMVWVTHEDMDDEKIQAAQEQGVSLSSDISILDIEMPGIKLTNVSEYQIRFRKQGYSDFVLIHIIDNEDNITIKIEPFLSSAQVIDGHIYLEDCI